MLTCIFQKVPSEQDDCLADIRRHRIDRYCVYGESVVPFTAKRRDFMLKMEEECCWRLGKYLKHFLKSNIKFQRDTVLFRYALQPGDKYTF